ncbi:MAG: hypothetical protein IT439_00940 [Phycisphaerales bacterium]|nr:hypothetical protein [Phycisphaerales bacterium]
MCPRSEQRLPRGGTGRRARAALLWAWCAACGAAGQPAAGDAPDERLLTAEDVVERYMRGLGLTDLVVTQLRDRLARASAEEKLPLAERLGEILAQRLHDAPDGAARRAVETLAEDLLREVPTAQSYDLRLNLAKARYLRAEEIAERARLLLATDDETAEAVRILGTSREVFAQVGAAAHRGVETRERLERRGGDNAQQIEAELATLRRQRSLAMYYAGWSGYYLAELTGQARLAAEAQGAFAYLLNAPGERMPTVDGLPSSLLQYEHMARAGVGVAMAASLQGDDATALRWLDALRQSGEVPPAVREQLFSRRMIVLARAKRWADVEWSIHRRGRDGTTRAEDGPLTVVEARLLAVLALTGLQTPSGNRERDAIVQSLAQQALGELVRRGEVGHVLSLVRRFDAAVIGEDGFIVRYVAALGLYEDARAAHGAAGGRDTEPTSDAVAGTRYREAALAMRKAVEASDAGSFKAEASKAQVFEGLSLFYSRSFEKAAEALQRVFASDAEAGLREEALWFAIAALDRAAEEKPSIEARRDEFCALFLQSFPGSERAARLLIRRGSSEMGDPQEAARVLLAVQPTSALYRAARGHAATLLYRIFRSSRAEQRDFAAVQFVEVAGEVVELERAAALEADAEHMVAISRSIVLRLRQIADALLATSAPDYARAERTIEMVRETASAAGIDTSEFAAELAYRSLQVGLGRQDRAAIERALEALRTDASGKYAEAADNLMYREALRAFSANPHDEALARDLLRFGLRIADTGGRRPGATHDPGVQTVFNRVAEAATFLWQEHDDTLARDIAVRLDKELLDAGVRASALLRRYAFNTEASGDLEAALECWRQLLAGLGEGTPEWFEARYHSARVLGLTDPQRALSVLDQHATLNPDYGPEPWGAQLRALHAEMRERAASAPPAPEGAP